MDLYSSNIKYTELLPEEINAKYIGDYSPVVPLEYCNQDDIPPPCPPTYDIDKNYVSSTCNGIMVWYYGCGKVVDIVGYATGCVIVHAYFK